MTRIASQYLINKYSDKSELVDSWTETSEGDSFQRWENGTMVFRSQCLNEEYGVDVWAKKVEDGYDFIAIPSDHPGDDKDINGYF